MTESKIALRIRDMTLEDLDDVAAVHKSCFPASIFSELDDELVKCFYRQAVEEPQSYAAVLEDPIIGKVVGFAIGTTKAGYRKRLLLRHPLRFCWSTLKGLFTSPLIWLAVLTRVLQIRKILAERPKIFAAGLGSSDMSPAKGMEALFMPIAVHADYRGGGNASQLTNCLTEKLLATGATRVIGKVAHDNIASIKLFRRLGWQESNISEQWLIVWIDKEDFFKRRSQEVRKNNQ